MHEATFNKVYKYFNPTPKSTCMLSLMWWYIISSSSSARRSPASPSPSLNPHVKMGNQNMAAQFTTVFWRDLSTAIAVSSSALTAHLAQWKYKRSLARQKARHELSACVAFKSISNSILLHIDFNYTLFLIFNSVFTL